jgi:small subunit ribosomal protein S1
LPAKKIISSLNLLVWGTLVKKYDFNWEEDDSSFEDNKLDDNSEFKQLFDATAGKSDEGARYRKGEKVRAMIVHLSEDGNDVMLELGVKDSGIISKQELIKEDGSFPYKVGDSIEAFVVARRDGEILLSNSLSHKVMKESAIEDAYSSRIPVRGKVTAVNKGGFEVSILGRKAFCPISQIDLSRVTDGNEYINKEFDFLVQKMQGRDVVVSRAALLKIKAQEALAELKEGEEIDGIVKDLRDFGAMVDIGGVVGMLHISEISYGRVNNVSEVLSTGDRVRVKILKIEDKGQSLPRISLSRKQAQSDPWLEVSEKIHVGDSYSGKVVRLTHFGAFVEIFPGVDGLIHVSEMSWLKRVSDPSELLKLGDQVEVRVLEIDSEKRRISLSIKSVDADPWLKVAKNFHEGSEHEVQVNALKGFGALVELTEGVLGLVPRSSLFKAYGESYRRKASPPQKLKVKIVRIDNQHRKILLSPAELGQDDESQQDYEEFLKLSANKVESSKDKTEKGSLGSFGQLLADSMKKKK